MDAVPELVPRPVGTGLRVLSAILPGVRHTTDQIRPYTRWWSEQNQQALDETGPLIVAIGDSTSVGIGASNPWHSFVGRLADHLSERDDEPWRVINLAIAGARIADAIDRQVPTALGLPRADLYTCCIGTNDVVWTTAMGGLRAGLRQISASLPTNTVFGPVAGTSARARAANRALRTAVSANGQRIAPIWSVAGPPARERLADDRFHPNDLGYELMASAVLDALDGRPLDLTRPLAAGPFGSAADVDPVNRS